MASTGLVWGGVSAALAGVVVGGACLVTGAFVRGSTVQGFARAPSGCTTTLEFDETDTFTLFAETRGTVDDVDGGCGLSGGSFEHHGALPEITLTMTDPDGAPVALGEKNDYSYDTNDFTGASFATVDIPATGSYRLTVQSDAEDVVIAIGRDPERDSLIWVAAGMTIAVLGMAIGLVLVILGLRRKPVPPAPPAPPVWGMTVGTNMSGYTPVGAPPPPTMPAPPGPGPWTTLPPPPPPPPSPQVPPPPAQPRPEATGAGPALPPPPPPPAS
jgi:hypothetical protein